MVIALGLVAAVVLAFTGAWWAFAGLHTTRTDLITHTVRLEKLQQTIVERGALESAENRDVVCRVKAGTKNSTTATTIKWVIEDGTLVSAGQKLVELDDSGLQEQLKSQKIVVDQARASWIQADENYKIVESQNESDIAAAAVAVDLAVLDLEMYKDGEYLQTKRDIEGRRMMARSDLEMWEERSAWSDRMSRPSRRYVTAAQAEADRARMTSAGIALKRVDEEMRVLESYAAQRKLKELDSKITEARRALDRVKKQAIAKLAQEEANRAAKQSIYYQEGMRYREIEDEIRKCVIFATQPGLVVYFVPEQSRFGSGSQQSIVAQGEPVREGQKLMRIPDLSKMCVNTRVHEAMISRVRGEKWQRTGFSDCVQATLAVSIDPLVSAFTQIAFASDRQDFNEEHRKVEQRLVERGQPAQIRVDSFPGRVFRGHVTTVATVASQQDFLSSDVKVYQTMVAIDEPVEGLRPGMSAQVTVFTDARSDEVLAIPVQAIVGAAELGRKRKCYVMTPTGPQERDIIVGISNETMAEVKSGLEEGDEIVLNPRVLLNPKERTSEGKANGNGKSDANGKHAAPGEEKGDGAKKKGWKGKGAPGGTPTPAP